jgi:hypothetical protein
MTNKIFPRLDQYADFTIVKMAGTDEDEQASAREHVDDVGTRSFLAAHPDFYCCDENEAVLTERLDEYGDLPATRWNLEIVCRELLAEGKLKAAPPPAAPEVDNSRGIKKIEDLTAVYVPSDAEAATLSKLADDPNLSDHARKARDRKLALLAGQQRRELASQNLYR